MVCIKRLILDVLKPHRPNALDFARALADLGKDTKINLTVESVDEKTENVLVVVEGEDIDFTAIEEQINELGATVHSIDEVEVVGTSNGPNDTA